jgi:hypothetical protein
MVKSLDRLDDGKGSNLSLNFRLLLGLCHVLLPRIGFDRGESITGKTIRSIGKTGKTIKFYRQQKPAKRGG